MAPRRVIIRESEFKSMSKLQRGDAKFVPFTKDYFAKRATYFFLKGKKYLADQYNHYEYPMHMIGILTNFVLHKQNYSYWLIRYNDAGEMVIRAGLRQPESRLGFINRAGSIK